MVAPTELLWLNPAGWINRFAPQHEILSASRQLIEWHTRRLVTATPGVVVRDGLSVLDLRMAESGQRVAGIRCEQRSTDGGSDDGAFVDIDADLVVDATGRRSRLPDWLERRRARAAGGDPNRRSPRLRDADLSPSRGRPRLEGRRSSSRSHRRRIGWA